MNTKKAKELKKGDEFIWDRLKLEVTNVKETKDGKIEIKAVSKFVFSVSPDKEYEKAA
jgi:hypothetical protein